MEQKSNSAFGFTLIELLIAIAIFSIVIVFFITMFLAITRVQVQQSSLAEVNGQSQFLLREMQYYIEQSSLVDMPADTPTTTLTLRMPSLAQDPTVLTLASGTLYLQQAGGTLQPLSSGKVTVSNLAFTRRSNAPAHDSVGIAFTVAYNTANPQQFFSEMLQTSVARVSAATFDSSIYPSSTSQSLGGPGQTWSNINGEIYFSGANVGIGVVNPLQTLDVGGSAQLNGGVRLNTATARPTCDGSSNTRGMLWFAQGGGTGGGDTLQVCVFTSSSIYQWATLY